MVRVVNEGPDPSVVKKAICRNCGAKLEYIPKDVQHGTNYDYGGGSDAYSWITCPKCNASVEVK